MDEIRQRLTELEVRFTYQEQVIDELNRVVTSCNLQIEQLGRENGRLREMLRALAPELPESPDE